VRLQALARGLANVGIDVTVHTCPPHYPSGIVDHGYSSWATKRARDGNLEIFRSPVLAAPNRGVARRLLDHASFAGSALANARKAGSADVVIAETPPLFLAAAAPSYARLLGAQLVLHVSDLWPDSVIELGAVSNRHAIRLARAMERHAYRGATRIVAPTAGITAQLERDPAAQGKAFWIPPAVDVERFAAPPVRRDGPLRVVYAGTVGMAQGVTTLVEAAKCAGSALVSLTIAGDGAELDDVRRAARGASHIAVLGPVAADAVPGLYADADVGAVLLRDRPLFEGALPTKTFEAMAAGRPVLLAARGEAAALVEDAGAGRVATPESVDSVTTALIALASCSELELQALGARAVACARRFDRGTMLERWLLLLRGMSASPI